MIELKRIGWYQDSNQSMVHNSEEAVSSHILSYWAVTLRWHDMTTPTEEEEVITSGRKEGRLTTLPSLAMTRWQQWDIDMYVFLYLGDCSEWVRVTMTYITHRTIRLEGVMFDNQSLRVVGHGMHWECPSLSSYSYHAITRVQQLLNYPAESWYTTEYPYDERKVYR